MKEKIQSFLDDKVFGSFEQMRVEMELRYKAQKVILTTSDHTKLHCYWVPCYKSEQSHSDESSDDDEDTSNTSPTMIFCNPNAGFAEYFQY